MRGYISWTVSIVLLCWGIFSALSILSDLKFIVDGWDWSLSHVALSFKAAMHEIGKQVSGAVSGYRAVVHGLVRLLHLPLLPRYFYDNLGIFIFSIGRGYQLFKRDLSNDNPLKEVLTAESWPRRPTKELTQEQAYAAFKEKYGVWRYYIVLLLTFLVFVGIVAVILSVLFGIDYLYRHFSDLPPLTPIEGGLGVALILSVLLSAHYLHRHFS
jgi:hypothetical protein